MLAREPCALSWTRSERWLEELLGVCTQRHFKGDGGVAYY
jgi:hypothetical protein